MVQLSHPSIHDYWKTIPLTRWTFVGKVMSLLFNMLSRLVWSRFLWSHILDFLIVTLPIYWKDWCWSSHTLATRYKEPIIGKDRDTGRDWGERRSRQQRMRWLDSITDSMDMNLSKLQETVKDRGACHVAVHGVTTSWTRLSNWTTTT